MIFLRTTVDMQIFYFIAQRNLDRYEERKTSVEKKQRIY